MITISATAISATAVSLTATGTAGGIVNLLIQYGTTKDFQWRPAPIVSIAASGDGAHEIDGLNQANIYFFRARSADLGGVPLDGWSNIAGVATPAADSRDLTVPNVVISPVLIVPPSPVLSWIGDNEIPGHPARCLERDAPSSAWWSLAASSAVAFEATMTGAPIDTIAVLDSTAAENATITVKGDTTLGGLRGISPAFSYGPFPFRASRNLPGRGGFHALVRLPAPQSYPLWRVEISGTMAGGLFAATYAVLGLARTAKNYSQGKEEDVTDLGTFDRARNGTPIRTFGHRMRKVSFDISMMTIAQEETQFQDLGAVLGLTGPALVIPNSKPGAYLHDRLLYGTIAARKSIGSNAISFTDSFTVDSLL